MTIEDLNFFDCGRGLHLHYGAYLIRVGLDSLLSDQMPEELAGSYPEGILLGIELHIELLEESEGFP